MIRAIIFDMDGLLIDSEPLWQQAEKEVFGSVGVPLDKMSAGETTGMRNDETVHYWYERYPWEGATEKEVQFQIENLVISLIRRDVTVKPGVYELIGLCERLDLPMAIASSSTDEIIQAGVEKLGIGNRLKVIYSACAEPFGKPNPAVYITTAKKLAVDPGDCLVFEDSVSGVKAAKAAAMRCVAVPAPEQRADKQFSIADLIVGSLSDVTITTLQSF